MNLPSRFAKCDDREYFLPLDLDGSVEPPAARPRPRICLSLNRSRIQPGDFNHLQGISIIFVTSLLSEMPLLPVVEEKAPKRICYCGNRRGDEFRPLDTLTMAEAVAVVNNLNVIMSLQGDDRRRFVRKLLAFKWLDKNAILTPFNPSSLHSSTWLELARLYHFHLIEASAVTETSLEIVHTTTDIPLPFPVLGKHGTDYAFTFVVYRLLCAIPDLTDEDIACQDCQELRDRWDKLKTKFMRARGRVVDDGTEVDVRNLVSGDYVGSFWVGEEMVRTETRDVDRAAVVKVTAHEKYKFGATDALVRLRAASHKVAMSKSRHQGSVRGVSERWEEIRDEMSHLPSDELDDEDEQDEAEDEDEDDGSDEDLDKDEIDDDDGGPIEVCPPKKYKIMRAAYHLWLHLNTQTDGASD